MGRQDGRQDARRENIGRDAKMILKIPKNLSYELHCSSGLQKKKKKKRTESGKENEGNEK
jgi:hypothetical protein